MEAFDPSAFPPEYLAEDRRHPALIGLIFVVALSGLVVLVRVYARWRVMKEFGWDDGLICFAAILNVAVMALTIKVFDNGAGLHLAAVIINNTMVPLYKWLVSAQLTYCIALWTCRMSGLLFYRRLDQSRTFTIMIWISIAFVSAVGLAQTLILALQCIPLSALWGATTGVCMGNKTAFISTAVMTVICDAIVLLLPFSIIFKLKANLKRKIALAIVLGFGVFAVAASICRVVAMVPAVTSNDPTWFFSVVMVWSNTEISAAIIALSLPALKGLFTIFMEGSQSHSKGRSADGTHMHKLPSREGGWNRENTIYQGPFHQKATTSVQTRGDNVSEEELWPSRQPAGINVQKSVRVHNEDR